jgi:hypothetical protein
MSFLNIIIEGLCEALRVKSGGIVKSMGLECLESRTNWKITDPKGKRERRLEEGQKHPRKERCFGQTEKTVILHTRILHSCG